MNAVRTALIEDRRWYVLDAIAQMSDRKLNEDIVRTSLRHTGRPANVDDVRNDLLLLERAGCVKIEKIYPRPDRELWIAELLVEGLQVLHGEREIVGVAARRPL